MTPEPSHIARKIARPQVLVHAVLLIVSAVLLGRASYEDSVYAHIAGRNLEPGMEGEEALLRLTHVAHRLVRPRHDLVGPRPPGFGAAFLSTGERDLLLGGGCGISSAVLARLLHAAGFRARLLQLICDDHPQGACHVVVEARLGSRWVVLDPQYDHVFRTPEGAIAGLWDIRARWEEHRRTVPEQYDLRYDYNIIRHTNWSRIPLPTSFVEAVVGMFPGSETFSLRSHVLNRHAVLLRVVIFAWLAFALVTFGWKWRRRSRPPHPAQSGEAHP